MTYCTSGKSNIKPPSGLLLSWLASGNCSPAAPRTSRGTSAGMCPQGAAGAAVPVKGEEMQSEITEPGFRHLTNRLLLRCNNPPGRLLQGSVARSRHHQSVGHREHFFCHPQELLLKIGFKVPTGACSWLQAPKLTRRQMTATASHVGGAAPSVFP